MPDAQPTTNSITMYMSVYHSYIIPLDICLFKYIYTQHTIYNINIKLSMLVHTNIFILLYIYYFITQPKLTTDLKLPESHHRQTDYDWDSAFMCHKLAFRFLLNRLQCASSLLSSLTSFPGELHLWWESINDFYTIFYNFYLQVQISLYLTL